jgi:hypothetical protein
MIFSDLPSPAEASSQTTSRGTCFAQAGNRYPLSLIMLQPEFERVGAFALAPTNTNDKRRCVPLPTIERFDAQDGREMPRDLLPALALVETGKDRAAIGPEVHPHRIASVTPHCLPQDGEVAGFLG